MLIKRAYLAGEHDGEPLVRVLRPGEMEKVSGLAPAAQRFCDCLKPDPRYTYVLCNAMGYSEFYGSNSNKDWYGYNPHLDFNGLLHTWDDIGENVTADQMKGKAWPYGYPCFYGATVYAHHKNTDPQQLGFGDVIFATINPVMKRIELVKRVFNEEAAKKGHTSILDRVRAGERVDVSMGCFKAGAMVTMADGTKKPIERVAVGDRVRTHTGGTGRVTELHRRKYRGEFYEIKPANEDAFTATVEHPFFAARGAKDTYRVWKAEKPTFDWMYARDLDGAVLSRPKVMKTLEHEPTTPEWARLVGYYLAEGHVVFSKSGEPAGIELTVNHGDAVNDEIAGLCEAVGTRNAPVWRQRENSDQASAIGIYDPKVAEVCARLAGRYSKTKRLAEDVLYWPEELQYELLGAYFNGDGFEADGDLLCSTASEDLAHQVREILFRLGVPTSYQCLRHPAGSGMSHEDTFEWVISIGKQWVGRFAPYCTKARVTEISKTKNIYKDYGDLWAVPIREYVSYFGEADVYNFEVEGDNSYLVNGVAAHNCKVPFDFCSICTDWAEVKKAWKTYDASRHRHPGIAILEYHRKVKSIRGLAVTKVDYCQHMISEGGKVYPDGRKVFVYNDFPRFFDISFVWIGADRTARVMWHLSSPDAPAPGPRTGAPAGMLEKLLNLLASKTAGYSTKESMIEKEIPGGIAQGAFRDSDTTPELSMSVIVRGSGADPKKILSTLAALGIIPTPGEFQSLVLPTLEKGDLLKQAMDERFVTFDTRTSAVDNTFAVSPGDFDPKLASAFSALMPERSSFSPFLTNRMMNEDKVASAQRTPLSHSLVPELSKLAAMYNGFRLSVLEQAPHLFPKCAEYLDIDLLSGGEDAGIEPGLGELLLGQGPVIQLISSHLRRSGEEGSQISKMAKLIAESASFDAMHTIGANLRQTMSVDKTSGLVQAAERLFNKAGQMV